MTIPVQRAQEAERKEGEAKEKAQVRPRFLSLQKKRGSQDVLKGLKRSQVAFRGEAEEEDKWDGGHCRLRKMVKVAVDYLKDTVIVLSANFLVNEHSFWEEESVEESAIRYWRELQGHANLVWICSKEGTARKLAKFSRIFNLRLDSVFLLSSKNSKAPTFSCNLIESEYGFASMQGS
jgi:hypothetical protein